MIISRIVTGNEHAIIFILMNLKSRSLHVVDSTHEEILNFAYDKLQQSVQSAKSMQTTSLSFVSLCVGLTTKLEKQNENSRGHYQPFQLKAFSSLPFDLFL